MKSIESPTPYIYIGSTAVKKDRLILAITVCLVCLLPITLFAIPIISSYSPHTYSELLNSSKAITTESITESLKAQLTDKMEAAANGLAPAPSAPPSSSFFVASSRPRIILFGDSLTERGFEVPGGWANCLAANYTRKADVVNRGLSGYNTRWARQILPYVFGPPAAPAYNAPDVSGRVLFSTLFFGANDAARLKGPSHSVRQHVPVEEYSNNLKEMVSYMRASGVERIVLLTPPPVWEPGRKVHQVKRMGDQARDWELDRTLADTAKYAEAAAKVAQELGLPCLDLQTLLQKEVDWGNRLLCDGLHFTPAGQEKLWQLLSELLRREWPEISPEKLPLHFPAWDAINFDDIPSSFTKTD